MQPKYVDSGTSEVSMSTSSASSAQVGLPVRRERLDRSSSVAVVHDGTAYLAALLPDPALPTVAEQAQHVIDQIDAVLARCGTSKRKLVTAVIYCNDSRHFDEVAGTPGCPGTILPCAATWLPGCDRRATRSRSG